MTYGQFVELMSINVGALADAPMAACLSSETSVACASSQSCSAKYWNLSIPARTSTGFEARIYPGNKKVNPKPQILNRLPKKTTHLFNRAVWKMTLLLEAVSVIQKTQVVHEIHKRISVPKSLSIRTYRDNIADSGSLLWGWDSEKHLIHKLGSQTQALGPKS